MIKILNKQSNNETYGIQHFIIDYENELNSIKIDENSIGSTVFCIENSTLYMLNSSYKWCDLAFSAVTDSDNSDFLYDGGCLLN